MQNILSDSNILLLALLALNSLIIVILLIMNLINSKKIAKLNNKYNKFMDGVGEGNIEELLEHCIDKINKINIKEKETDNKINIIERNMIQCIQKVGIVRYNAFENVGSDLSFSIALLDNSDSGIIISGIYSRESSLTYAKPLTLGKSKYALSAEEIQALEMAKRNGREWQYTDK